MLRGVATRAPHLGVVLLFASAAVCTAAPIRFESAVQLHRNLRKPVRGTFILDETGAEFRGPGVSQRWTYSEIKTFTLAGSKELTLTDYGNRHWHEPGERKFEFTLAAPITPSLAAQFAALVARPVINGDPEPHTSSFAEIAAHRRERFGGSNGMLRFRDDGIDYTTPNGRDARSWRWSDIQTIATSDPWQFRVTAYREIVEFDLKQPMARELFDRLWDKLYAQDLNVGSRGGRP